MNVSSMPSRLFVWVSVCCLCVVSFIFLYMSGLESFSDVSRKAMVDTHGALISSRVFLAELVVSGGRDDVAAGNIRDIADSMDRQLRGVSGYEETRSRWEEVRSVATLIVNTRSSAARSDLTDDLVLLLDRVNVDVPGSGEGGK